MGPLVLVFNVTMFMTDNLENLNRSFVKVDITNTQFLLSHLSDTLLAGFLETDASPRDMPSLTTVWVIAPCQQELPFVIIDQKVNVDYWREGRNQKEKILPKPFLWLILFQETF